MIQQTLTPAFVGLDTETVRGKAVLVCTPIHDLLWPKTFEEIFSFMSGISSKFCAFNMDYDVRALLCFLPSKALREMAVFGRTTWRGYRFRYIPRKLFTVRVENKNPHHKGSGFDIYDCYQFYQMSLDKASREVLKRHKKNIPKTWLRDMSKPLGNPRNKEKVISYCKMDAALCESLFANVKDQFEKLGIDFSRPISTGSLALKTFGYKVKNNEPPWVHEAQRRIYFGGRVEVFKRGFFENCYLYDIASAYPHALSQFYDPKLCSQLTSSDFHPEACYGIYDIQVHLPTSLYVSPVPYDLLGYSYDPIMLTYPVGTFRLRVDRHTMDIVEPFLKKIFWAREWFRETDQKWFPEIPSLFLERKRRPDISLAIKLTLNSLYGKFAERRTMILKAKYPDKGDTFFVPGRGFLERKKVGTNHTNFLVASHITGFTRAVLYRAMIGMPASQLVSCATDGIITQGRIPALNGPLTLGGWQEKGEAKKLISIGSGIYAYNPDGSKWINKFRGYKTERDLVSILADKKRSTVSINVQTVNSLQECVRRGEIQRLNEMLLEPRYLDVNFDRKRAWVRPFQSADEVLHSRIDSSTLISG